MSAEIHADAHAARSPNDTERLGDYMFVDLDQVNRITSGLLENTNRNFAHQRVNLGLNMRQQELKEEQFRSMATTIFLFSMVLLLYVVMNLYEVRVRYAYEIQIYKLVRSRGPPPLSEFDVGIECILLSLKYHELFKLANGLFACSYVERQAAWFLILMLQEFPSMKAIHWSGNATQLNAARLEAFLEDYDGWKRKDNEFRFLFQSRDEFRRSVAVMAVRRTGVRGSVLESLFLGGFCRVAIDHTTAGKTGKELAKDLLARVVVFRRECGAEKHMRRVKTAVETANNTGSAIAGGVAVTGMVAGGVGAATATTATPALVAVGTLKGLFTGAAVIQAAVAKASIPVASACAASTLLFPICFAIVMAIIMAAVAAVVTAIYASQGSGGECTGGDYYIIEEDANGNEITTRVDKPVAVICQEASEGEFADIKREVMRDICED